tara:strand:+ start:2594 stop:3205 length:612 start_codon:yes stop_codon:yes gene_type:complete
MKFGTKNIQAPSNRVSPYISWGKSECKINDILIQEAKTGAKRVTFALETRPCTEDGFTAADNATSNGKVGTVTFMGWMNSEKPSYATRVEVLNRKINQLAVILDKGTEVDAIEADSLEDYVMKLKPVLCGKFAHYVIAAEEYAGQDKDGNPRTKFTLNIPDWNFVSNEDNLTFDKSKLYHYKPLPEVDTTESADFTSEGSTDW